MFKLRISTLLLTSLLFLTSCAIPFEKSPQTPESNTSQEETARETPVKEPTESPVPVITKEYITTTEEIPFETRTAEDPDLPIGETIIDFPGESGIRTIVHTVTYNDGVEISRTKSSDRITKEPLQAMQRIGTKAPDPENNPKSYSVKSKLEQAIFLETNRIRKEHGLQELQWDDGLYASARDNSDYLFQHVLFEHTNKYNVGENLYRLGSLTTEKHTAKYIVQQWMDSPGHRSNILDSTYTRLAVAVIVGDIYYDEYKMKIPTLYATQHFMY